MVDHFGGARAPVPHLVPSPMQQGESDHKHLLESNQHGEDASTGDWQGQSRGDREN